MPARRFLACGSHMAFFFFQAEDGIRDLYVTGVQTCALPICTGDVGRVDEDGFVWIEGRVSDMINRGGLKVFPAEVEEVLRLAPGIIDVAVVGVADERLGEVPWAFVVAAPGEFASGTIEAHCRRHLAPDKVPVRFEAVDALPRYEVGKVVRPLLVQRADAGRSG